MGGALSLTDWLEAARAAQHRYITELGWPVALDVDHRRLFVATGRGYDAVTMPVGVGRLVAARLRTAGHGGPAVTDRLGAWWTFLIQPADRATVEPTMWAPAKVRTLPRGTTVAIPHQLDTTVTVDGPMWNWMVAPDTRPLPTVTALSTAIHLALARLRSQP